jgi:hypothetical protein
LRLARANVRAPKEVAMSNDSHWCFGWFAETAGSTGKDRAALVKGAKWKSGDTITIGFLDGSAAVQGRVKQACQEWVAPGMANLTFSFLNDVSRAVVRISFKHPGSWSTIGTTCRQVTAKSQPTMNYGWLTETTTDEEVRRVVLHEFGHMLGLIHEHQNPVGGIKWNRDAVIRDLSGPPNSWPLDTIEFNMFQPFARAEVNATRVDPESIMMYPIPSTWTTDGFSVGLNGQLSASDRTFIKQQYR